MTIAICKTCGQQFDLSTGHDCPGLFPASSTQSDNTAPTAGLAEVMERIRKILDGHIGNRHIRIELSALVNALATLSSAPAGEPWAVKPLEWEPHASDCSTFAAETIAGRWVVWEIGGRGYMAPPERQSGQAQDGDINAAKAAAQRDFEARITACLEVSNAR